ncbi:RES family NAD+ phosphorylase [Pelagibacterium xiamenense]|uniref:RES family NAD+ phosphorylase n=1 Tax=Pelagibacterium xiamenense TaxID=2901140 RepID=UPI001E30A738|nr:RES family NAD+ phosphorylase [Pelagibacterium xiamenense]MCD7059453.1 RES family NAD+ phosphorylase [Pelagibacterium xiamenense]
MVSPDDLPVARVSWPKAYRIIRSIHPPVDLFEDIADPRDWEALASAESKTNPRLREQMGTLALVPPERRVGGPGASYLMAPFVHVSPDRPGRFTDGSYGIYSAGNSEEVALREVAYHHGRTMAASAEAPGWTSQFRVLVNSLDLDLCDVRGRAPYHDPDDYSAPQALGKAVRRAGGNGVVYDSVRCPGGACAGVFWPDLVPIPVQGDHFDFHWDGARVDQVHNRRTGRLFAL